MIKKKLVFSILAALIIITAIVTGMTKETVKDKGGNAIGAETDFQIIGIEPGAGIMSQTRQALKDYQLDDWQLQEGSSAAMAAELSKAYGQKKPIIVTGWAPHWMFSTYDLKFLKDPNQSYGAVEDIHTIVRKGLEQDAPGAYTILDQFSWKTEDIEKVMVDIKDGTDPVDAADKWIKAHSDKVAAWTKGAASGNRHTISLVYVAWDTEIASTNVIGRVLEQNGFKVKLSQVEVGPMFAGVANGSADGMVAGWLPSTHKEYYDQYKADIVDLGPNLHGTKNGLVVPKYMDINSIEDLK